jgi:hypothetical protein
MSRWCAIAERLAGDIPGVVGVEYLEHSAHMPFQEEPREYNAALLRFLGATDEQLAERRAAWNSARSERLAGRNGDLVAP